MENGNPSNIWLQSVLQGGPGDGPGNWEHCAPPLPHWDLGCQVCVGRGEEEVRERAREGQVNHQSLGNVRELTAQASPSDPREFRQPPNPTTMATQDTRALQNKTTMPGQLSGEAVWLVYPFSREDPLSEEKREEQRALKLLAPLQSPSPPHPSPQAKERGKSQLQGTGIERMPAAWASPSTSHLEASAHTSSGHSLSTASS